MLRTGALLHGTYRIDGYLSSGGFGNTYVATHVNFNERYALKEFFMKGVSERNADTVTVSVSNATKVAEFSEQLEKFKKEAQRLRRLQNNHIVRVHDLFEENGTAYYVMDFVEGENLKERLQRTGKPMIESEVKDVLCQVLDALGEVHSQGLWHMDLKPANVMLDRNGVVKLIDFGASKQFNASTGGALSTSAVTFTNGYAPIEQMERSYDKFGPWTDFYALGATLYNLLTNRRPPMPSDINDDMTPDKHVALPMSGAISAPMRNLVLWLMRTNRVERPSSVNEILDYMKQPNPEAVFAGKTVKGDDATRLHASVNDDSKRRPVVSHEDTTSLEKPKKSKGKLIGIIAAAIAAVALVGGLMAWLGNREVPVPEEEVELDEVVAAVDNAAKAAISESDSSVTNMKVVLPLGKCVYSGSVNKEGMPHGKGTAVFPNGDRCEGTFVNGNLCGSNISYHFFDGYEFFGTVNNNSFYEGTYTGPSGDYFVGYFADNLPDESRGARYDKDGNEITKDSKQQSASQSSQEKASQRHQE